MKTLSGFCFVSSIKNETYRIYFDFKVNYLHGEVQWPIKVEFVNESPNVFELSTHAPEVTQKINGGHKDE